jgi:putative SOS response-associated peptidase YedK
MCGRFTQHYSWQQVHEFPSVIGAPQNLQPHYNIAPTTLVDTVRHDAEGHRELVRGVRWGLIPCELVPGRGQSLVTATQSTSTDDRVPYIGCIEYILQTIIR